MTATNVKFPKVHVKLSGQGRNPYDLVDLCAHAARAARVHKADIEAFKDEALSGDYDHLLATAQSWFIIR